MTRGDEDRQPGAATGRERLPEWATSLAYSVNRSLPVAAPGRLSAFVLAIVCAGAAGGQPKIAVNFNIHLDPGGRPNAEAMKAELARRRDNLVWLAGFLRTIGEEKRPVLDIQMGGEHAEFYLQDEAGFELLKGLWEEGHLIGTHMHRQTYLGEPHRWGNVAPSRPLKRPEVPEGELLTPGILPESNSLDEIREQWRLHYQFTDKLIGRLIGSSDLNEIRKYNNHGNNHMPNSWESAENLFKDFRLTVQTGGRNEVFNMLFDHDVFNPWRPSEQHALIEDLTNHDYVCVPQLAVVGNISAHFGVMQDLSLEAMQRRFLQIVAERREQQRQGLPPKIWNFGWTMHSGDLNPEDGPPRRTRRGTPRHSRRPQIVELVRWINENFEGEVAWKTSNQVAADFYRWEREHPSESSFHYPHRKVVWDDYPYALRGAAQALMGSHFVGQVEDLPDEIKLYELVRVQKGSEWVEDERGLPVARKSGEPEMPGDTTRLLFGWSEAAVQEVNLSRYGSDSLTLIEGASGERRAVGAARVPIGPTPVVAVVSSSVVGPR